MVCGLGNDIIEVHRIEEAIKRNHNFLHKIYSEAEVNCFEGNYQSLAGNFAAKEAVAKALGTGFRGFEASDIEILRDNLGKPYVNLYNGAKTLYQQQEIKGICVSVSHTKDYAVATCILEK